MKAMAECGVSVLGGCCGTTPEHIRRLREVCGPLPLLPVEKKDRTVVSSYGQAVILGERPVIIGERINPTGKPRLKQALKDRDMAYILNMAASQEENGADILDVNGSDDRDRKRAPERNRSAAADRYLRRKGHGTGHADL